jgi:hypothetical protein
MAQDQQGKVKTVKGSNGLLVVRRTHISKRGKTYKRTRQVAAPIDLPKWWTR